MREVLWCDPRSYRDNGDTKVKCDHSVITQTGKVDQTTGEVNRDAGGWEIKREQRRCQATANGAL